MVLWSTMLLNQLNCTHGGSSSAPTVVWRLCPPEGTEQLQLQLYCLFVITYRVFYYICLGITPVELYGLPLLVVVS